MAGHCDFGGPSSGGDTNGEWALIRGEGLLLMLRGLLQEYRVAGWCRCKSTGTEMRAGRKLRVVVGFLRPRLTQELATAECGWRVTWLVKIVGGRDYSRFDFMHGQAQAFANSHSRNHYKQVMW